METTTWKSQVGGHKMGIARRKPQDGNPKMDIARCKPQNEKKHKLNVRVWIEVHLFLLYSGILNHPLKGTMMCSLLF